MIVTWFGSSDQTHRTNYSGNRKEWPVYSHRRNTDLTIRSKPLNLSSILVALPPIPPKSDFKGHGKRTAIKEQHIPKQEVLRMVLKVIFCPLHAVIHSGKRMLCVDGRMRQCFPVICAWMADYFKNIHLHLIKQPHCPVCEAPKSSSWQLETIGYTSKRWYSWAREMRQREKKQDNIWKIEWLEPQKESSGIWNASLRRLLSYPIFFTPCISVCLSNRWTG